MEASSRIATFDIAKAVVMLLVVGGHIYGNGIVANANEWCDPYYGNFTVGVDMPLFFMISGYFSANSLRKGTLGKLIARTVGFLWPVISFGVIFGVIIGLTGTKPLWKVFLYPVARVAFADWFLRTIAIVYLSFAVILRLAKTESRRLILLLLLYVGLFFAPRWIPFHWTSDVMHMFPYFVFGMLVLRPFELHKKTRIAIPAGLFFLSVVLSEGNVNSNGMSFYNVTTDWHSTLSSAHLFLCFWARTFVGISGGVFVLWLFDTLCSRFGFLDKMAVFGTTTLGVYIMHQLPIFTLKEFAVLEVPLGGFLKWPLAISLFLACHFLTVALRRSRLLNTLLFGNEKLLEEKIDHLIG